MIRKLAVLFFIFLFSVGASAQNEDSLEVNQLPDAEVSAVRWKSLSLTPATQIIKPNEDIQTNVGFDIPQSLQSLPSLIFSSDAGNNIGYTNMKIRGSDATRINVSINGVPYNDAESQNTFFVDIADIMSSTEDIQITNGIGSSTNGTGALGASISINTSRIAEQPGVSISTSFGYYNTMRNSIKVSTGKLNNYKANLRLSSIQSDGYVERATSNLKSWQINQSLMLSSTQELKLLLFGGSEVTGQAWNGISPMVFDTNPRMNFIGQKEDGTYYDNQVDDYTQNHAQLFLNSQWNPNWTSTLCLYLTNGEGFYEEYKLNQDYADYGLGYPTIELENGEDSIVSNTSLIRQLWLSNRLIGNNFNITYAPGKTRGFVSNVSGYGVNLYNGLHFGNVKWAKEGHIPADHMWYDTKASKYDLNLYNKTFFVLGESSRLGVDLQYRHLNYEIYGFRDNPDLETKASYDFFNPKISYNHEAWDIGNGKLDFKAFLGRSSKEPIRGDFENTSIDVKPESVVDLELGTSYQNKNHTLTANMYSMRYKDQLILTGKINDVGAYIRENVPKSSRTGIELSYTGQWGHGWSSTANASFARNKIDKITVYYDDYDNGGQISEQYRKTDISFSPNRVAYLRVKAVSKQFMDNTQNLDRSIPAYTTMDFLTSLNFGGKNSAAIFLQVLNLANRSYFSNGYTFSYQYGQFTTESYIYPQARLNIMLGFRIDLVRKDSLAK